MKIKGFFEEAVKDSSRPYLPKPINIFSTFSLICKSSKTPRGIAESCLSILRMLFFYSLPIQNAQHATDIYLHYLCSKYSPHFCCCLRNVQAVGSSGLSQEAYRFSAIKSRTAVSQNLADNINNSNCNTNQQTGYVYASISNAVIYPTRQIDSSGQKRWFVTSLTQRLRVQFLGRTVYFNSVEIGRIIT